MKILIIGVTGFIGKSIYNFLKRGDHEIVASICQEIDFAFRSLW